MQHTAVAVEWMKAAVIPRWIEMHTKKNEKALGDETCIAARWTTGKESSNMEPRPQHQNQDMQICGNT